jgi:hypothetical protein
MLPVLAILLAGFAGLSACKKKGTEATGGGDPQPGPEAPAVSSEYLAFAHIKAKDVWDNPLFAEVMKGLEKHGATDAWNKAQTEFAKELGGLKPTDIETVTICVPEFPDRGEPKLIAILTTGKAIDKKAIGKLGKSSPDNRGF